MNRIATMLILLLILLVLHRGQYHWCLPPSDNVLRTCPHHSLDDFIDRWRNVFPAIGLNY